MGTGTQPWRKCRFQESEEGRVMGGGGVNATHRISQTPIMGQKAWSRKWDRRVEAKGFLDQL